MTTGVDTLPAEVVAAALDAGAQVAEGLRAGGHIVAAVLFCQEQLRVVGPAQGEIPGVAG